MAIYHLTARSGSRQKGKSAAAKYDYINRCGRYAPGATEVVWSAAGNMPGWAGDPSLYWQAADRYERANATLFREYEFSLPYEISPTAHIRLVKQFTDAVCGTARLPHAVAIHRGGGQNPHVHLIVHERGLDDIERDAETWFSRANKASPERGGAAKSRVLHGKQRLHDLRALWAELANAELAAAGADARIDHRSLRAQRQEQLDLAAVARAARDGEQAALHEKLAAELDREPIHQSRSSMALESDNPDASPGCIDVHSRREKRPVRRQPGETPSSAVAAENRAVNQRKAELDAEIEQRRAERKTVLEEARARAVSEVERSPEVAVKKTAVKPAPKLSTVEEARKGRVYIGPPKPESLAVVKSGDEMEKVAGLDAKLGVVVAPAKGVPKPHLIVRLLRDVMPSVRQVFLGRERCDRAWQDYFRNTYGSHFRQISEGAVKREIDAASRSDVMPGPVQQARYRGDYHGDDRPDRLIVVDEVHHVEPVSEVNPGSGVLWRRSKLFDSVVKALAAVGLKLMAFADPEGKRWELPWAEAEGVRVDNDTHWKARQDTIVQCLDGGREWPSVVEIQKARGQMKSWEAHLAARKTAEDEVRQAELQLGEHDRDWPSILRVRARLVWEKKYDQLEAAVETARGTQAGLVMDEPGADVKRRAELETPWEARWALVRHSSSYCPGSKGLGEGVVLLEGRCEMMGEETNRWSYLSARRPEYAQVDCSTAEGMAVLEALAGMKRERKQGIIIVPSTPALAKKVAGRVKERGLHLEGRRDSARILGRMGMTRHLEEVANLALADLDLWIYGFSTPALENLQKDMTKEGGVGDVRRRLMDMARGEIEGRRLDLVLLGLKRVDLKDKVQTVIEDLKQQQKAKQEVLAEKELSGPSYSSPSF